MHNEAPPAPVSWTQLSHRMNRAKMKSDNAQHVVHLTDGSVKKLEMVSKDSDSMWKFQTSEQDDYQKHPPSLLLLSYTFSLVIQTCLLPSFNLGSFYKYMCWSGNLVDNLRFNIFIFNNFSLTNSVLGKARCNQTGKQTFAFPREPSN